VDRKSFNRLCDGAVPPAFNLDVPGLTVNARLGVGASIASQLRCRHELLTAERNGDGDPLAKGKIRIGRRLVSPLGDEVLGAEPDQVLHLLADHRVVELQNVEKRMSDKGWKEAEGRPGLRSLYGYTAGWEGLVPAGSPPLRVASLRIGLCLAADATFAPYAAGLMRAMAARPAALRADVLSVALAIWSWAMDHAALAYALSVARTDLEGAIHGFPSFSRLVRRVLSEHLETSTNPEIADALDAASGALAEVATAGIGEIRISGASYEGSVGKPMLAVLAETHPDWLPEEIDEDAEEVFARGAAPLVLEGLIGLRDAEDVAADLESLALAMRDSKRNTDA
jgi:hypothetical protein